MAGNVHGATREDRAVGGGQGLARATAHPKPIRLTPHPVINIAALGD